MSAPSDAQIGFGKETTYDQAVAPSVFVPLLTPDLQYTPERLESEGVIAGLDVLGSEQWNGGNIEAGGNAGFELYAGQSPLLFELMFGQKDTVGLTDTFVPTAGELPSATVQVGNPGPGSAVIPSTWTGCKVADWEIACSQGAIATLGMNLVARNATFGSRTITDGVTTSADATLTSATAAFTAGDVGKLLTGTGIPAGTTVLSVTNGTTVEMSANATATGTGVSVTVGMALATASYAVGAGKPLKFNHCHVTIGGQEVDVTDLSIKGDNGLAVDRRFLGSQLRKEPLREARRSFTASLTDEFRDLTHRARLLNGSEHALVANFTAGAAQVEVSGNVRYDKTDSSPDGKKITEEKIELKFVRSGATLGSAITAKIIRTA